MRRFGRLLAAASVLSLLVAACAGPGTGIAERIRAANSPIVREVVFSPANFWEGGGEEITDAQALDLWCTVVVPPGAEQLPPGRIQLRKGGQRTTGGARLGSSRVLANPVCPGDGLPTPTG